MGHAIGKKLFPLDERTVKKKKTVQRFVPRLLITTVVVVVVVVVSVIEERSLRGTSAINSRVLIDRGDHVLRF